MAYNGDSTQWVSHFLPIPFHIYVYVFLLQGWYLSPVEAWYPVWTPPYMTAAMPCAFGLSYPPPHPYPATYQTMPIFSLHQPPAEHLQMHPVLPYSYTQISRPVLQETRPVAPSKVSIQYRHLISPLTLLPYSFQRQKTSRRDVLGQSLAKRSRRLSQQPLPADR